jgi:hypothetical protein
MELISIRCPHTPKDNEGDKDCPPLAKHALLRYDEKVRVSPQLLLISKESTYDALHNTSRPYNASIPKSHVQRATPS